MKRMKNALSRRQTLQIMALTVSGSAATELLAKEASQVSPRILGTTSTLVDGNFSAKRLDQIAPALQRNLDQFQIVRDLEIDDLIEPAPVFSAQWR